MTIWCHVIVPCGTVIYIILVVSIDTLQTIAGCDSVVTMDLTINNTAYTIDSMIACDSLIWNGNVYDSSGVYVDTLQTTAGCDSIVTLDLTINYILLLSNRR